MSTLKEGDVIYFQFVDGGDIVKGLIVHISQANDEYSIIYSYSLFGRKVLKSVADLKTSIEFNAYWINKPFVGLEII